MTKYKVVWSDNRKSCVIPEGSKFSLTYKEGIVTALKDSIGIMVFKTRSSAKRFIRLNGRDDDWQILKVNSIGRKKKTPKRLCGILFDARKTTFFLKTFYKILGEKSWLPKFGHRHFTMSVPAGSECYDSVEVME